MAKQRAANSDWQEMGGTLKIPDGSFVNHANFDIVEPYISIIDEQGVESMLIIPKALAYYLSVHHCGSNYMKESYIESGRQSALQSIKRALDL